MSKPANDLTPEQLDDVIEHPLNDEEVQVILEPDTHIYSYPELKFIRHIDDIFDSQGRAIILYLLAPNYGHWVCLINRGDTIEFFDSYGKAPDSQIKFGTLGQDAPYLTNLIKASGKRLTYNRFKFQKSEEDVNTCGRHCISRLIFKELTLPEYKKLIRHTGLTPDEFVSELTAKILGH